MLENQTNDVWNLPNPPSADLDCVWSAQWASSVKCVEWEALRRLDCRLCSLGCRLRVDCVSIAECRAWFVARCVWSAEVAV